MKLMLAMACAATCTFAETFPGSAALDASTEKAIRDGLIRVAVLIVGHDGKIVHRKAYGARALVNHRTPGARRRKRLTSVRLRGSESVGVTYRFWTAAVARNSSVNTDSIRRRAVCCAI